VRVALIGAPGVIERALTVRETCRPQGRNLHDYLLAAITAALHGQPAPSLLPSRP